jgi:hypothetical protein
MRSTTLSCVQARRLLMPFHDGELEISQRVRVWEHIESCPGCRTEALALQAIRKAVRADVDERSATAAMFAGLQARVLSRWKAERAVSWSVQLERVFEDRHLIWAGLSACCSAALLFVVVVSLFQSVRLQSPDSLAAVLSTPMLVLPGDESGGSHTDNTLSLPEIRPGPGLKAFGDSRDVVLAALVSRDGRVDDLEVLRADYPDRHAMGDLLHAAAAARFRPARVGGTPVPFRMVWLVTRTTVRGKIVS